MFDLDFEFGEGGGERKKKKRLIKRSIDVVRLSRESGPFQHIVCLLLSLFVRLAIAWSMRLSILSNFLESENILVGIVDS